MRFYPTGLMTRHFAILTINGAPAEGLTDLQIPSSKGEAFGRLRSLFMGLLRLTP